MNALLKRGKGFHLDILWCTFINFFNNRSVFLSNTILFNKSNIEIINGNAILTNLKTFRLDWLSHEPGLAHSGLWLARPCWRRAGDCRSPSPTMWPCSGGSAWIEWGVAMVTHPFNTDWSVGGLIMISMMLWLVYGSVERCLLFLVGLNHCKDTRKLRNIILQELKMEYLSHWCTMYIAIHVIWGIEI